MFFTGVVSADRNTPPTKRLLPPTPSGMTTMASMLDAPTPVMLSPTADHAVPSQRASFGA